MKKCKELLAVLMVLIVMSTISISSPRASALAASNGGVYLDPLTANPSSITEYISENNLRIAISSNYNDGSSIATNTYVTSGKWYWEEEMINYPVLGANVGIAGQNSFLTYFSNGINNGGTVSSYGSIICSGDVIGVLLDADNGIVEYLHNGVSQGKITISVSAFGNQFRPFVGLYYANTDVRMNFGTSTFKYPNSIPIGYRPYSFSESINLTTTTSANNSILNWNAIGGTANYSIKYSTTAGGPYTTLAATSSCTYTVPNLSYGTTYYYVVSPIYSNGSEGSNSNEVSTINLTASNAILEISMTNGIIKEYALTANELDAFLYWYDSRSNGIGKSYYKLPKKSNVKPFLTRKEYLSFDKIYSFEVNEYNE